MRVLKSLLLDLPATTVAQTFTFTVLALGWLYHEAPDKSLRLYGFKKNEKNQEQLEAIFQTLGATAFAIGILGFCTLYQGTNTETAALCYFIFWTQEHLRALLNQVDEKAGVNPAFRYFWLPVASFAAYACFSKASYAMFLIQIVGVLTTGFGLPVALTTEATILSMYGIKKEGLDPTATAVLRLLGFTLASVGVLLTALASGIEPAKAMGCVNLVSFVKIFSMLFVTKDFEKCQIDLTLIYMWFGIHAFATWICVFK